MIWTFPGCVAASGRDGFGNFIALPLPEVAALPQTAQSLRIGSRWYPIAIPFFIVHGREDPVAAVGESKRLIRALKKNRIPHGVMLKSGEVHGFYFLENRVELFARIEPFIARNLAPRPTATTIPVPRP
ncbi:MAG: prolyl oligopeptidase family serine peptidase [Undibacterium sp.]|nr:prolyl oligopeptidase family serine peptidase [Opitutaceae bacterium]